MLRAIRNLGNASVAKPLPSTTAVTEPAPHDGAERRQLTVPLIAVGGS